MPSDFVLVAEAPTFIDAAAKSKQWTDEWLVLITRQRLMIMAKRPLANRITVEYTKTLTVLQKGKETYTCFAVFQVHVGDGTTHDSWTALGRTSLTFVVGHIHYTHAKKRNNFLSAVDELAKIIMTYKPVMVGIDANMGMYALCPALVGKGVPAHLAAYSILYRQAVMPTDSSRTDGEILYDSCGLIACGPLVSSVQQPHEKKLLDTAAVTVDSSVTSAQQFTTGFPLSSYFNFNNADKNMLWADDAIAKCKELDKRIRRVIECVWASRKPRLANSLNTWVQEVNGVCLQRANVAVTQEKKPLHHEVSAAVNALAHNDPAWISLSQTHEFGQDLAQSDPDGQVIHHGGHFTCTVKVSQYEDDRPALVGGPVRQTRPDKHKNFSDRSAAGEQKRRLKDQRKSTFNQTGAWPWWICHDSDKVFWTHPSNASGQYASDCRGYKGYYWRLTQQWYIDQGRGDEVDEYNQRWIQLYGEEASKESLAFTEQYLQRAKKKGWNLESFPADTEDIQESPENIEKYLASMEKRPASAQAAALQKRMHPRANVASSVPARSSSD